MIKIYSSIIALLLLSATSSQIHANGLRIVDKTCIKDLKVVNGYVSTNNSDKNCFKSNVSFSIDNSLIVLLHHDHMYFIGYKGWSYVPNTKCCTNLPAADGNHTLSNIIESAKADDINYKNIHFKALRIITYGREYLRGQLCIILTGQPPTCFIEDYKNISSLDGFPSIKSLFKPSDSGIEFTLKSSNYLGGGAFEYYTRKYIISNDKITEQ